MQLTEKGIADRSLWEAKAYGLPSFDREAVEKATRAAPFWIHFGAGNIFRAFQANIVQELLNEKVLDRGLVLAGIHDYETIEKMYRPHDNLSILVTLKGDGTVKKTVIASIMESLVADRKAEADWSRLCDIFRSPSLQMVSFTITEKGYALDDVSAEEPAKPESSMGKIAALLYERYLAGALPLALVSMDNCSHNGDRLFAAVNAFAEEWEKRGLCRKGFCAYVGDKAKVSFPWTMIDKITPRPDAKIAKILEADGVEGLEPVITAKKTYVAPFVNAEECQYLVIEDAFPNGRPALEKAGIYFADRATVGKVEKMKVCTCLNPLHTFLALAGCLLGYTLIADEMKDPDLLCLVKRLGYDEGLPVVVDPGIISPRDFIDEVVNIRIPNPFMPDTPQRIACDTSQKLPIRFGETIKGYMKRADLDVTKLRVLPLTFALWLRYLMAVDDAGKAFELSPDPLLETVRAAVPGAIAQLLHRADIFGVDLYEAGLAGRVSDYFARLSAGTGAVRKLLKDVCREIA